MSGQTTQAFSQIPGRLIDLERGFAFASCFVCTPKAGQKRRSRCGLQRAGAFVDASCLLQGGERAGSVALKGAGAVDTAEKGCALCALEAPRALADAVCLVIRLDSVLYSIKLDQCHARATQDIRALRCL